MNMGKIPLSSDRHENGKNSLPASLESVFPCAMAQENDAYLDCLELIAGLFEREELKNE
ncbi:hypothetical protein [Methylobacter sp. BlB1]|jgi:hypothetical protein|uniref:hypothetical protein n=1 Tax=Methylobacter sp. BlB1 TaxID=2785914 RepID=UPI00189421DE|nr:hypothetical protein [Methylobacter sp. BlB1]